MHKRNEPCSQTELPKRLNEPAGSELLQHLRAFGQERMRLQLQ